jgi:hypothetical protein
MSTQILGPEVKETKQPGREKDAPDLLDQSYPAKDNSLTPELNSQRKFSPSLTPSNILKLQRSIGNQAVQRLITREKASGGHRCDSSCNHIQRHMNGEPKPGTNNTQVQRHMGHDHDEEDPH